MSRWPRTDGCITGAVFVMALGLVGLVNFHIQFYAVHYIIWPRVPGDTHYWLGSSTSSSCSIYCCTTLYGYERQGIRIMPAVLLVFFWCYYGIAIGLVGFHIMLLVVLLVLFHGTFFGTPACLGSLMFRYILCWCQCYHINYIATSAKLRNPGQWLSGGCRFVEEMPPWRSACCSAKCREYASFRPLLAHPGRATLGWVLFLCCRSTRSFLCIDDYTSACAMAVAWSLVLDVYRSDRGHRDVVVLAIVRLLWDLFFLQLRPHPPPQ